MPLLRATDLSLSFGPHVVLEEVSFQIDRGERICLVGRNGAGKSTLLKLVAEDIKPDGGSLWRKPTAVVARLEQELPAADGQTVMQVVASGLAEVGELLEQYQALLDQELDDQGLKKLEHLQHELDAKDGWLLQQRVDEILTRLNLPKQAMMSSLSGGWRKRVALAKALVTNPDVLLLDEPTNHLDIESIEWLEAQILNFEGAVLFITHDRMLTRRLATKIMELDRGHLREFRCGYDKFLEERAHLLEVEEQQNALFDKKLAQEEAWIRQGIKARRTRNEGRVRALKALRQERSERRTQQGVASFDVDAGSGSGKLVVEAQNIAYAIDGKQLIKPVDIQIIRGDKIGLLGPNGVGKTTLLRLLLGELEPTQGKIKRGTNIQLAYFDQMREQLDDEKTIIDTVGQGRESIEINGKQKHVMSYLSDFLFSPQRARTPLKSLSGGERNRVQLAYLFSQPANVLVMDEPTNDLDVETLELLETILVDYEGTVLLVSHDRDFMDNVVTSTLVFEGQGQVREYVGGYQDWLRQGGSFESASIAAAKTGAEQALAPVAKQPNGNTVEKNAAEKKAEKKTASKKLSYKDQRELEQLPEQIEKLEQRQQQLEAESAEPDFYQGEHQQVNAHLQKLQEVTEALESCYERWLELSE